MRIKSIILALVFAISASAQTTVTPQSTNPVIALNAVAAATTSSAFINLGQNVHTIAYSVTGNSGSPANVLEIYLEGSSDCTTYSRVSDIATNGSGGQVFAAVWYPCIRVNLSKLTCTSAACAVTATYVGTSANAPGAFGPYNSSGTQHRTVMYRLDALSTQSVGYELPITASQVTAVAIINGTCTGSTITIQAGTGSSSAATAGTSISAQYTLVAALTNNTTPQVFVTPNLVGMQGNMRYDAGSCTGTPLVTIDVFFTAAELIAPAFPPGPSPTPPPAFADFLYNYATALWEPRLVPTTWKVQTTVAVAAATDVTLWTPSAGKSFRLMGYRLTTSVNSPCNLKDNTAGTIFWRWISTGQPGVQDILTVNGYLSTTADNKLVINCTNAVTLDGMVWGVEQ